MTSNETAEDRITAIVLKWNEITKQDMKPRRFCMSGEIMHFVLDGEVTPDEIALVAKYMLAQNKRASESRYIKPLDLYRVMSNIAKFEATLQLAKAYFRNQVKVSAGVKALQEWRGLPEETVPDAKRVTTEMLANAINQLSKQ